MRESERAQTALSGHTLRLRAAMHAAPPACGVPSVAVSVVAPGVIHGHGSIMFLSLFVSFYFLGCLLFLLFFFLQFVPFIGLLPYFVFWSLFSFSSVFFFLSPSSILILLHFLFCCQRGSAGEALPRGAAAVDPRGVLRGAAQGVVA